MRTSLRRAVVGASALAIVGSALALGAGAAQAAVTPGWQPDANAAGGLYFYDAAGHQITSGSITDTPMAPYYVGSGGAIVAGNNKAFLAFTTPVQGANSATWAGTNTVSSTQAMPAAGLPGDLTGTTNAVVHALAADGSLQSNQIATFPNSSAVAGYQGLYEVRIYTTDTTNGPSSTWYAADVQVTGTTWAQVWPVQTSTTTTLAPPTTPITSGTNVTLNATVAPASPGKVQFFDGGVAVGTPQTVTGASGAASIVVTAPAVGSHPYTAVFTPTPGTPALGSTSTVQTVVVQGTAIPTSTALAVNIGTGVADGVNPVMFTATVTTSPNTTGTVTFKEGAVTLGTSPSGPTSSPYVFSTTALAAGSHTVTATFNAPAGYNSSTSAPQTFALTASACPTGTCDKQTITADIPAGTIVINTPYTAAAPLDVPLSLDPTASFYTGNAAFNSIKVTDTRAGDLPWDLKAQASPLTFGANAINGENVGLTGLIVDATATNTVSQAAGNLTVTNAPAASPPVAPADPGSAGLGGTQHTLVHAVLGLGSITYKGLLTINAPTNLPAGTYTGTITFTVG